MGGDDARMCVHVCVSAEAVAVAEVAKVEKTTFWRRVGSCDSLKAFRGNLAEGGGQRGGIFMKAIFPT